MQILIREPSPLLVGVDLSRSQVRIQPLACPSGDAEHRPAEIRHPAAVRVIEADYDKASGAEQRDEPFEPAPRIAGVMENAVAEDHIELVIAKRQAEQVGLQEPHAVQGLLAPEL